MVQHSTCISLSPVIAAAPSSGCTPLSKCSICTSQGCKLTSLALCFCHTICSNHAQRLQAQNGLPGRNYYLCTRMISPWAKGDLATCLYHLPSLMSTSSFMQGDKPCYITAHKIAFCIELAIKLESRWHFPYCLLSTVLSWWRAPHATGDVCSRQP